MSKADSTPAEASPWREPIGKEDWWAVWIGLGLVLASVIAVASGSSIKWIAVTPQKWSSMGEISTQIAANAPRYFSLFILFSIPSARR